MDVVCKTMTINQATSIRLAFADVDLANIFNEGGTEKTAPGKDKKKEQEHVEAWQSLAGMMGGGGTRGS